MIWVAFFIITGLLLIYMSAKKTGNAECQSEHRNDEIESQYKAKTIRERLRVDNDFARRVRAKFRR